MCSSLIYCRINIDKCDRTNCRAARGIDWNCPNQAKRIDECHFERQMNAFWARVSDYASRFDDSPNESAIIYVWLFSWLHRAASSRHMDAGGTQTRTCVFYGSSASQLWMMYALDEQLLISFGGVCLPCEAILFYCRSHICAAATLPTFSGIGAKQFFRMRNGQTSHTKLIHF